jgi:hypothetical protein
VVIIILGANWKWWRGLPPKLLASASHRGIKKRKNTNNLLVCTDMRTSIMIWSQEILQKSHPSRTSTTIPNLMPSPTPLQAVTLSHYHGKNCPQLCTLQCANVYKTIWLQGIYGWLHHSFQSDVTWENVTATLQSHNCQCLCPKRCTTWVYMIHDPGFISKVVYRGCEKSSSNFHVLFSP